MLYLICYVLYMLYVSMSGLRLLMMLYAYSTKFRPLLWEPVRLPETICFSKNKQFLFYLTRRTRRKNLASYRNVIAMSLPLVLLLSLISMINGVNPYYSLWLLDLRQLDIMPDYEAWPGYELFRTTYAYFGRNDFTMITSHRSQYWFRVDAVYLDDPDNIKDVSDLLYNSKLRDHRTST